MGIRLARQPSMAALGGQRLAGRGSSRVRRAIGGDPGDRMRNNWAMRYSALFLLLLLATSAAQGAPFLRGADISSLPRVEAAGARFTEDSATRDPLQILKDAGANTIRLRLWHTPAGGYCGRAATLDMAERAHKNGLRILLDFHYSATWADPGHQQEPAAWRGLPLGVLADSVRIHTRDVLLDLRQRGIAPVMVQLGSEITGGMLWDSGRVTGAFDKPERWDHLATVLKAGAEGGAEAFPGRGTPGIMLHLDAGGNNAACRHFLDRVLAREVPCDAIGLSYYPWWHGTHNPVGQKNHLLPGYPDTPAGQAAFLDTLRQVVVAVPDGHGRGIIYWEPAWVAARGSVRPGRI